jgi:hypothetical protein
VVEALQPERSVGLRTPLIQILFVMDNVRQTKFELPSLAIEPVAVDNPASRFDVNFHVRDVRGDLACTVHYNPAAVAEPQIADLIRAFLVVADTVSQTPTMMLAQVADLLRLDPERNGYTASGPGKNVTAENLRRVKRSPVN